MSKPKHTKGPLKPGDGCKCTCCWYWAGEVNTSSAAPDLLDALQTLIDEEIEMNHWGSHRAITMNKVMDALQKAKGG